MFNKGGWYDEREGAQDKMLEDLSSNPGPLHSCCLLDLCLNWGARHAYRSSIQHISGVITAITVTQILHGSRMS